MKIYFSKVFQLDPGYQEILIDANNFSVAKYNSIGTYEQSVNGVLYKDIYILEPLSFYKIILKENTPSGFTDFYPNSRLMEAGLMISDIDKKQNCVFAYNCSNNHIFLKSDAIIGEIE